MPSNYIFQKFGTDGFSNEIEHLVSIEIIPLNFKETWTFLKVSEIVGVSISEGTLNLLKCLLSKYNLMHFEKEFISIGINLQNAFISFHDTYNDDILDDFKIEDSNYKYLLNVIEEYLFNTDNYLQSISFNFNKKNSAVAPIKNKIVIDAIMAGITDNLGINVNNFESRKTQFLRDIKSIKKGKGGEFIRTTLVQEMFKFLKKNKPSESDYTILKFIGCFLHICQIPFSSTIQEIQIESLEAELSSIDVSLMRLYIDRPKSFFTK